MKQPANRLLLWTPRVLAILFAAFISMFAFDVFGEGYTFWETIVALVMHLVPTAAVLVALAIAWRWSWVGGILFLALGLVYILVFREGDWIVYLLISGPLFLVGALFLCSAWAQKRA
jgi:hypothetical protein